MRRKTAMIVALVGGAFLLISGTNGVATFETMREIITELIGENQLIIYIFAAMIFIASLGGISVMFGGVLIGKGRVKIGKILILLGTGTGLIGLVIQVLLQLIRQGDLILNWVLDIGTIGIVLSVVARKLAK